MIKITLKKSQLDKIILKFFNEDYYPDFGWTDSIYYKKNLDLYGIYNFYIDGILAYTYFEDGSMEINSWLVDDLNSRFNDNWILLFKRWFETNTGLTVYDIVID